MLGHGRAQRIENRIERLGAEIIDPFERRRRREQAEVVGAFRQQAVDEGGIDAFGREHRVGDALRRILVEIEAGGAERQIEIGHDRSRSRSRAIAQAILCDTVDAPTPPLAPTTARMRPTGLASGAENSPQTSAHDVERPDRRDQIIADAAADEFAVEQDVVVTADDDHAGPRVADLGEGIEAREDVGGTLFEFQDDHVRRRRGAIRLARGGHAAHLDFQMRLGQPPVFPGRLDRGRGFNGFAESLDRDPRGGRDVLVARRRVRRGVSARE